MRPPFKAATPFDTLKRVDQGHPLPPDRVNKRVPAALQWICLKCLEKDPLRRYPTAAELAADLRRFLAGNRADPVRARPPGGSSPAERGACGTPARDGTVGAGAAVSGSPHRRAGNLGPRGRGVGRETERGSGESRLAIHHRRCTNQAETTLPVNSALG